MYPFVPRSNECNNKYNMKKTLSIALSLGCFAMAAQTTEQLEFDASGQSSLSNRYDLSEDWEFSLELAMCPGMQREADLVVNLASFNGTNFTLELDSVKPIMRGDGLYVGTSLAVSGISKKTDLQTTTNNVGPFQWSVGTMYRVRLTYTATLSYSAEDAKITFTAVGSNGITAFNYSVNKHIEEGTILTDLSTGLTQEVVDYFNSEGGDYWSIPTGAFTGTVVEESVPEPATATLSLLALAGLAARRRRR